MNRNAEGNDWECTRESARAGVESGKIYDGSDRLILENWIIINFLMFLLPLHNSALGRLYTLRGERIIKIMGTTVASFRLVAHSRKRTRSIMDGSFRFLVVFNTFCSGQTSSFLRQPEKSSSQWCCLEEKCCELEWQGIALKEIAITIMRGCSFEYTNTASKSEIFEIF